MIKLKLKDQYEKSLVDLRGYFFTMVKGRVYLLSDDDAKYILSKYSDCVEVAKPEKVKETKPKKAQKIDKNKKSEKEQTKPKEE